MDQLAYKATKAMVGYKVNSVTKNVKEELGFGDDKKKADTEHEKQKKLVQHDQIKIMCVISWSAPDNFHHYLG